MPFSFKKGKKEIKEMLTSILPKETKILDVGPGSGTYFNLMGDYFENWDACEIHEPYISQYNLKGKYKNVFVSCATQFQEYSKYDLVILGDILEHLTIEDAQDLLCNKLKDVGQVMVAVPYEYPQGASKGVESERHLQPDLTKENFEERYPGFELVVLMKSRINSKKEYSGGYYLRKGSVDPSSIKNV